MRPVRKKNRNGFLHNNGLRFQLLQNRLLWVCFCFVAAFGVIGSGAFAQPAVLTSDVVEPREVQQAIERLQTYLLSQQNKATGRWDSSSYDSGQQEGGLSALVVLALLESGMSVQQPELAFAVSDLQKRQMVGTYARSLRAQCMAKLSRDFAPTLGRDVAWLTGAQLSNGSYTYTLGDQNRTGDNSNTHFGVLGLAAYEQWGNRASVQSWQAFSRYFLETQNEDGGWGYTPSGSSTPNMTAAGLNGLLGARSAIHRKLNMADRQTSDAIDRAFVFLADHADKMDRVSHGYYGLLAIERCLLWDGRVELAGIDWYRHYARKVIDSMTPEGAAGDGKLVDTAFALIFLSRGQVPVWASKLQLNQQAWHNRPNDLNHFCHTLSDWREAEIGWQVVKENSDPLTWLNAPVLWTSVSEPLVLTPQLAMKIRRYMQLGGLWVINPEKNTDEIRDSVQQALDQMQLPMPLEQVDSAHPLMSMVLEPKEIADAKRPWVAGNQARAWVVCLPNDHGRLMQSGVDFRQADRYESLLVNLYAWSTDRGQDRLRLQTPLVEPPTEISDQTIRVIRAGLLGQKPMEWYAWTPFVARFGWVTNQQLLQSSLALEQVAWVQADLVHVAGVDAVELTEQEIAAIKQFVQRGGTVLVETIGGRGDFARSVSKQLQTSLGQARRLRQNDPPIWSKGVSGVMDQREVVYQGYTQEHFPFGSSPRLRAHWVGDRPAVVISDLDLSLALMRVHRYGINGYRENSARGLMTNLLLTAQAARREAQK